MIPTTLRIKHMAYQAYASAQVKTAEALRLYGSVIESIGANGALLATVIILSPTLVSSAKGGLILGRGTCNLQHVIYENLGKILTGIKGRDNELIHQFRDEIGAIKSLITSFIGKMVTDLENEMGGDAVDYNLDNHSISHAFEDWLETADLTRLGDPSQKAQLRALLRERINLQEEDTEYSKIIEQALESDGFLERLQGQVTDLKDKTTAHLERNRPQGKQGETSEDDFITPGATNQQGSKTRNV